MIRLFFTAFLAVLFIEGNGQTRFPVEQFIDINTMGDGLYNLAPTEFIVFKDVIYFGADDGQHGLELWRSDGTDTGTYLVADINPGSGASNPYGFIEFNQKLFFSAKDDTHGIELWMTDGTNGGTKLLSDINPSGDAMPDQKAVMGNKLYFQADNGSNGYELWITDGTAGGTLMLIDLNNTGSSFPRNMTAVGTNLVFWAQQNGTWKLFRSNGTKGGTLSIKGVNPFDPNGKNYFSAFFENNNTLYFSGYSSTYGEELWQTNGTDTGTTLVADMNAGGDSKPGNWLSHRFTLYFSADDGTHGRELWKLDKNGPTLVADINPGVLSSNPSQLMGWGYNLVVSASDSAGQEPWTIEPISGKASRLGNINPTGSSNPKAFALLGSQLFFMADDGAGMGFQLMNWDGQQLTQIKPASAFSVNPLLYSAELIPYHMGLYFEGSYDASKLELWRVRDTLNTTTGPLVRPENTACIYPIPANDAITIVLPSSEVISISNIAGQTIMPPYNFPEGQAILSTVDWPNGLYVMRTQGWSKKIMVQH